MFTNDTAGLMTSLARIAIHNQESILRLGAYVVRRVKAAIRFVRTNVQDGEAFAMYVRSRDETWACVLSGRGPVSTRLVVWNGCVLNSVAEILRNNEATPAVMDKTIDSDLPRARRAGIGHSTADYLRGLHKYIPMAAFEAAVTMDTSDAHFRRWRKPGSEETDRVDAIHVSVVDQTWALVSEEGSARLVILRGHHLDRLSDVHGSRLAEVTLSVVADI